MTRALITLDDYRDAARRRLPRIVFDYLEGGAGSERGLSRNREAFARTRLLPDRLTDVSQRRQAIAPFGRPWESPFAVAPMGLTGVVRPQGDLILARAAARAGIPFCLSTAATSTIEAVRRASDGELWFQLYVVQRALADRLVARAREAGCTTLVLTVDVAVNGDRVRDRRNGFGVPLRMTPRILLDGARHPVWSLRQVRQGFPQLAHFVAAGDGDVEAQAALMARQMDASFDWAALARLRDDWRGTLIVKGIVSAEDARHCERLGVDGVVVSNHGGRQLEDAPAPIDLLPAVVDACGLPVLMDSGVRDGADVVKAMAAGAKGVLVGRPLLYALAADGERGVDAVLAMLRRQVDTTLALLGTPDVTRLERRHLA